MTRLKWSKKQLLEKCAGAEALCNWKQSSIRKDTKPLDFQFLSALVLWDPTAPTAFKLGGRRAD